MTPGRLPLTTGGVWRLGDRWTKVLQEKKERGGFHPMLSPKPIAKNKWHAFHHQSVSRPCTTDGQFRMSRLPTLDSSGSDTPADLVRRPPGKTPGV